MPTRPLLVFGIVHFGLILGQPARCEPPAARDARALKATPPSRTDRYGDPLPPGAVARIGTARFQHGDTVSQVAFSPDGKTLASFGTDVRLWEASTGKERRHCGGPPSPSPFKPGPFSPDGKRLWLQTREGEIVVWDLDAKPDRGPTPARIRGPHTGPVAASPDGKTLATGDKDAVRLWDITTGKEIRRFEGHTGEVTRPTFSSDGKILAAGNGQSIVFWKVETGEKLRSFRAINREWFRSVALTADCKTVAVAFDRPRGARGVVIRLWDAATGEEIRTIVPPVNTSGNLAFSPDGKSLALACLQKLCVWNMSSGKMLWEDHDYNNQFYSAAFSPDSKTLAVTFVGEVRRYDVATGKEHPPVTAGEPIKFLALLGDGRTVASAAWGKPLRLWRLPGGEEIPLTPARKRLAVPAVTDISPDGKWMASGGHEDHAIRIWDIASGEEIRRLPHIQSAYCYFSPDGRWLGTRSVEQKRNTHERDIEIVFRFWDARTGKMISELRGDRATVGVFSPDGQFYTAQEYDTTQGRNCSLRSVPDGSLVRIMAINGPSGFPFSADGRLLAGASLLEVPPRMAEVASGKEIATLVGKVKARKDLGWPGASAVAFSPDGRRLVTGDFYGHLFCWDVRGRLLHQWKGDSFPIRVLRFTPDGKILITGGQTTALIWNMDELLPPEERRTTTLTAADLNALWSDLKEEDATRAYQAVWKLEDAPAQSVPFLRERLRAAGEPDKSNAQRIIQLVRDLDSDSFSVREKASRELEAFGKEAEPELRKMLAGNPSVEARRRAEALLRKMPELSLPPPPPDKLRDLRALAVLEHIGTAEATALLKMLAQGNAEASLTREAKASLARLAKRPAAKQ